jgi:microcin C transport system substrate-binding protein
LRFLRCAFALLMGYLVSAGLILPAHAQDTAWKHALSLFGEVKYPQGFKHFDYVNPQAPKGGQLRLSDLGTFDSFNPVIVRGNPAEGLGLIYESLMVRSLDEPSTEYGLLAEAVRVHENFSGVTYRLRSEARWHDGKPITVDDVIWSFEQWKKLSPSRGAYFSHVARVEAKGAREVVFIFDKGGNRELPQIVGQLLVLPKHWWSGVDDKGKPRDIAQTLIEHPLGSGPYRVKSSSIGHSIVYERVKYYWGRALPVHVGHHNFDEIRYDYYRDEAVAMEAFKADGYDFRLENIAKNWATAYDFPARQEGRVVLETFPERSRGVMQAFIFNLRRDKFSDPRLRRAFNLALDFEEMNRTLFYGQYERVGSYFAGLELASSGLPQGLEKDILESVRDKIPNEVFTQPFANPVGGSLEATRNNAREAARLLREAGWEIKDGAGGRLARNASGEPLEVELLLGSATFERVALPYKAALERLGVKLNVRVVDPSQYVNRVRGRDFDMVVMSLGQSLSPGNEQRDYWGSASADREGSSNHMGLKDAAVDALIDRVIFAQNREELVAATKALDRVLLAGHYLVPHWRSAVQRTARWDRFGHPSMMPTYDIGFPSIWWFEAGKAKRFGKGS